MTEYKVESIHHQQGVKKQALVCSFYFLTALDRYSILKGQNSLPCLILEVSVFQLIKAKKKKKNSFNSGVTINVSVPPDCSMTHSFETRIRFIKSRTS